MKKLLAIMLTMSLLTVLLASCTTTTPGGGGGTQGGAAQGAAEPSQIGMSVLNIANPFFVALTSAAEEYAAQHGIELIINDSQDLVERQIEALENFITMGVDAIIVTAVDPVAIMPTVRSAREDGIVVIAHTTALEEYDAWVAADEFDMGWTLGTAAGQWIRENLGDGEVQAATLNFDIIPQVINRKIGIMEGVHEYAPNVVFVADATAGDPVAGMEVTETFIQANPDLQVVLGINDGGALGAYEAFRAAGKTGDRYLIGGIDATPEGISRVKEGGIFRITVDQNPIMAGRMCITLALAAIRGEDFDPHYMQELIAVTIENADDF